MTSAARIPFTPSDENVIRGLGTWMTFVAVAHFVIGLALLSFAGIGTLGVIGAAASTPFGAALLALQLLLMAVSALLYAVEGVLLIQGRMALTGVLTSDSRDQALISKVIHRLKLFFMAELGFFGVTVLTGILGVVLSWVAPEFAGGDVGQDIGDLIRQMPRGN